MIVQRMDLNDLAQRSGLPVDTLQQLLELGLIGTWPELSEADLRELRRVRRLIEDLGLEHEAVEVVLHMRRRMLALQQELTQLQAKMHNLRRTEQITAWIEAEWVEP